jgi:sodium/proline symporter
MNRAGALTGILAGGLTVIVWRQLERGIFDLYELVPGFAASLAAAVLASVASERRTRRRGRRSSL